MSELLFTIDVQRTERAVHVLPQGELDIATAALLDEAVATAAAEDGDLVIDLRGVTFIDSTGLRTLVQAGAQAESRGYRLSIVRGAAVERILEISGLGDMLPLVDAPPA